MIEVDRGVETCAGGDSALGAVKPPDNNELYEFLDDLDFELGLEGGASPSRRVGPSSSLLQMMAGTLPDTFSDIEGLFNEDVSLGALDTPWIPELVSSGLGPPTQDSLFFPQLGEAHQVSGTAFEDPLLQPNAPDGSPHMEELQRFLLGADNLLLPNGPLDSIAPSTGPAPPAAGILPQLHIPRPEYCCWYPPTYQIPCPEPRNPLAEAPDPTGAVHVTQAREEAEATQGADAGPYTQSQRASGNEAAPMGSAGPAPTQLHPVRRARRGKRGLLKGAALAAVLAAEERQAAPQHALDDVPQLFVAQQEAGPSVAPVGDQVSSSEVLLPYLLSHDAMTQQHLSFPREVVDAATPAEAPIAMPFEMAPLTATAPPAQVPLPDLLSHDAMTQQYLSFFREVVDAAMPAEAPIDVPLEMPPLTAPASPAQVPLPDLLSHDGMTPQHLSVPREVVDAAMPAEAPIDVPVEMPPLTAPASPAQEPATRSPSPPNTPPQAAEAPASTVKLENCEGAFSSEPPCSTQAAEPDVVSPKRKKARRGSRVIDWAYGEAAKYGVKDECTKWVCTPVPAAAASGADVRPPVASRASSARSESAEPSLAATHVSDVGSTHVDDQAGSHADDVAPCPVADGKAALAPGAVVVDGEVQYVVEKILDHKPRRTAHGKARKYLVRWTGYGPDGDTWEPPCNLRNCPDMVEAYWEGLKRDSKKGSRTPLPGRGQERHLAGGVRKPALEQKRQSASHWASKVPMLVNTLLEHDARLLEKSKTTPSGTPLSVPGTPAGFRVCQASKVSMLVNTLLQRDAKLLDSSKKTASGTPLSVAGKPAGTQDWSSTQTPGCTKCRWARRGCGQCRGRGKKENAPPEETLAAG